MRRNSPRTRSPESDIESSSSNSHAGLRGKSYDEQAAMLAPSAPVQAKGGGIGGFFSRLFGGGRDKDQSAQAQQPAEPKISLSRNLGEGDRGPDVMQVQQELFSRGFYSGSFDGIFGKGTKLAVKRAQKAGGVAIDGIVGPNTLRVISDQPRAYPRAIVVDEGSLDQKGKKPAGRDKPKRSRGAGIALKNAGFTVPTGRLYSAGVSDTALRVALAAYDTAWAGKQTRNTTFTLVDFTKSDDERRLWVMDLQAGEVLRAEFVSHGYGSDGNGYKNNPDQFGNVSGSGKSSLGLMKAGKMRKSSAKYRTKTDAREFHGLERGHNDKVHSRSIIMHAAISSKSGNSYVDKNGVHGVSAGCWALDKDVNTAVIKAIPPGSLLYNYYPDKRYMETSNYLREFRAQRQRS